MEFWESLVQQSDDDASASQLLYEQGFFGPAAYNAQQCLEKVIKAFLVKNKLYTGALENLGHLTLIALINIVIEHITRTKRVLKSKSVSRSPFTELSLRHLELREWLLSELKKSLTDLRDMKLKLLMWKYSLNIEKIHPSMEKIDQAIDSFAVKDKEIILEEYEALRDFVKKTGDKQKLHFKQGLLERGLPRYIPEFYTGESPISAEELYDLIVAERDWKLTTDYLINQIMESKPITEHIRQTYGETYLEESGRARLISHIFIYAHLIARIFPHEEIGRYPMLVERRDSRTIYAERKTELKKLIDEVIDTQKKIRERLKT